MPAALRLIHPAPTAAVVTLSAALALIVSAQAGGAEPWRLALTVVAVLGSQVATGALNDWADRERDREARSEKPIPSGAIGSDTALVISGGGALLQLVASVPLGPLPTALGAAALAGAVTYNLGLSRTPLSALPYLVSFGILPAWIAAGVGVSIDRVLPAVPLVAPFAVAAHLANTLRDWDADAAGSSRSLAQTLGRDRAPGLAMVLGVGVGLAVGGILIAAGRVGVATAGLGAIGLAGVLQGVRSDEALWRGTLVAAVCWTAAWAAATGP